MTGRIFRSIVLVMVLAVLLASALLTAALYGVYEERISRGLRTEAAYLLYLAENAPQELPRYAELDPDTRVTLIEADGMVRFDTAAEADRLENHSERPEVEEARRTGTGESRRYSHTIAEMTMYYALRTSDGGVLRIASTRSSVVGVFLDIAPWLVLMLLAVMLVALLIARRAAKQIVAPVNGLNLDEPLANKVYDELTPLLTRMSHQHSQIRQQMHELEKAHSELAAVMENMSEGLVLLDGMSRVLSANGSAVETLMMEGEGCVGLEFRQVCREEAVLAAVDEAYEGRSGDAMMTRHGRTWRVLASPVLRQDRVRGAALLILDVTERYAAENSRREFTANVSHELKTPLTSISGYAEIIRDGIARPEDVPAFAAKIHAESSRLVALVNDILDLSRLDEKCGLGVQERTELAPILRSLQESFRPLAEDKGVALTLEAEETAVEGYPTLLRELFHNLIDNAVRYTPEGGSIRVTLRQEQGRAVCTVADTGIGIPQEHQPFIFERFYRVDKSHSRQTGGTGLGLAIVKHIAEVHRAEVHLDSQPGQGTRITVTF